MNMLLICFALTTVLMVIFITQVVSNLRQRDSRLADMRQRATEEEHIVRMGLIATGAAHELGTPLATMSVILGDWQRMPQARALQQHSQPVVEKPLGGEVVDAREQAHTQLGRAEYVGADVDEPGDERPCGVIGKL